MCLWWNVITVLCFTPTVDSVTLYIQNFSLTFLVVTDQFMRWLMHPHASESGSYIKRGVTALTRAVSGEKQIYSGNLEILPGIGTPGKFFGKYEIFSGHWHWAKIWYCMLSNNIICTVICTLCMRWCILCILTLENSLTPHDMKRPISNVSN